MDQAVREFRRVLGKFATGVATVSFSETAGITISSFNAVSLESPPSAQEQPPVFFGASYRSLHNGHQPQWRLAMHY